MRGRSEVPSTRFRTRVWRFWRAAFLFINAIYEFPLSPASSDRNGDLIASKNTVNNAGTLPRL